ncbi:hypothetical protein [Clostridium sp.]|uniref:hypothetical protein n=1 Tax=Clostridium sp. TaxID=1506 RepID=UPI003F3890A9
MDMNEFKVQIEEQFKEKYEKVVNEDFDIFYNSINGDIRKLNDKSMRDIIVKNLKRTMVNTKKNWNTKVISDPTSPFNKEINFVELQYSQVLNGVSTAQEFKRNFKCKNYREYKDNLLTKLNEWQKDESKLLTEYQYLAYRQKRSIKIAFKNDILKLSSNFFKDIKITRVPSIMGEIAIDTTNRIKFFEKTEGEQLDLQLDTIVPSTIDKLIYSDGISQEELLLKLEHETFLKIKNGEEVSNVGDIVAKMAILKTLKTFNNFDKKIILYFYQHFYEVFSGKKIEKYIADIVQDLGYKNQTKYRNMVEDSIAKIASMKISYNFEGHSVNGVFFEAKIEGVGTRKKATVYLSGIIEEVFIKDNTINFYDNTYSNLSADAQQLAVMFQKNRMKRAVEGLGYNQNIALMEFSRSIFWGTKRIDLQRKRIITALDELKLKRVVLKDYIYYKKDYSFDIEYIPFTGDAVNKIQSSEFKYGNIIEGAIYEVQNKK